MRERVLNSIQLRGASTITSIHVICSYLLKPRTSKNDPKPAETTRNQPKQPKNIAKRPKATQNFEIKEIWNFPLVFVFRISSPNAQIQAFWAKKYQLSNLSMKFSMYPISKVVISNLTFVFQNVEHKFPILDIFGQKILTF